MAVRSAVLMSCSAVYVTDVAVIRAAACEGLSLQPPTAIAPAKVIVETMGDADGRDGMRHGSSEMRRFSHIAGAQVAPSHWTHKMYEQLEKTPKSLTHCTKPPRRDA